MPPIPSQPYTPKGYQFTGRCGRQFLLVQQGHYTGWICYKHPDGHWVTYRLATEEELEIVASQIAAAN